jgi:hypothetical protein
MLKCVCFQDSEACTGIPGPHHLRHTADVQENEHDAPACILLVSFYDVKTTQSYISSFLIYLMRGPCYRVTTLCTTIRIGLFSGEGTCVMNAVIRTSYRRILLHVDGLLRVLRAKDFT